MASLQPQSSERSVKLGFAEEDTDTRLLRSHFFPSKVGGRPAWLCLDPLPSMDSLLCLKCHDPCSFLMQVYAPIQARDDTFHRTIFIFVCLNASCSQTGDNSSFKVLRSQLPLMNRFYSKDPPSEDIDQDVDLDKFPHAGQYHSLCQVCGSLGSKKCSQCKKVFYCSKAHQVADWKASHRKVCAQDVSSSSESNFNLLFNEFELVTEDEDVSEIDSNNSKSEEECFKEYEKMMMLNQHVGVEGKYSLEDLEQSATAETEDDKQFLKFKRRISTEPTQVLRYDRGGEPLWVSAYQKPSAEEVPNCSCGAPRIFEFQVMPQLLNYLKVDRLDASLDWGTLSVYTCQKSCNQGVAYSPEFLWKQDFHSGTKQ